MRGFLVTSTFPLLLGGEPWVHLSNEKRAPGCLRDLLGMRCYPIWNRGCNKPLYIRIPVKHHYNGKYPRGFLRGSNSFFITTKINANVRKEGACLRAVVMRFTSCGNFFVQSFLRNKWSQLVFQGWAMNQMCKISKIVYRYLEPKWPLFWMEFGPSFGGFFHPKIEDISRFQVVTVPHRWFHDRFCPEKLLFLWKPMVN